MSIYDLKEKIKPFYTLFLCIVVAIIFFTLGRLSIIEEKREPIKIIQTKNDQSANVVSSISSTKSTESTQGLDIDSGSGEVIGSKSGKKYYFPWCGTVKMIKPQNQIKFGSIEEAKKAGFVAGGNCKGLK